MSTDATDAGCALPHALREPMAQAVRLQWWKVFWTLSTVVVMGLAMGQSQTMKTAWIEDALSLVPTIAFLAAARLERRGRSASFPFGFERANGVGFFIAAVALFAVGALLLWDAGATLVAREHAPVTSVRLFGRDIWLGWLMIAAQLYALVPPIVIAKLELPLARALNDKLLHTDALMNKANWMTGLAGIGGIVGLGLGWWWADALAAAIISTDIIHDGWKALKSSSAELIDGAPRALGEDEVAEDARALHAALDRRFPGASILMRETGRLIRVEVHGATPADDPPALHELWPGPPERAWRLGQVTFSARPLGGDEPVDGG